MTDAWVKSDWIYKNESSHKIEVQSKVFCSFTLQPGEEFELTEEGEGPNNMKPEDYNTFFYGFGATIVIDDTYEYTLVEDESIISVANYANEKIEHNYYRFVYAFNDQQVEQWISNIP